MDDLDTMMSGLEGEIEAYLADHWDQMVADLDALVSIESTEDLAQAAPSSPFGPGPRAALTEALGLAQRMGLDVHDCEGYIGYADLPGASDTQIGIIGHVDVVPAGPGWTFEPYRVTRRDGYLVGRGVADDKGPLTVALHAVKFWRDKLASADACFPYTLRVLFGANEETNMGDVAYYRAHFADPAFLFTPDAEFPVSYGEAGICHGVLRSAPIAQGALVQFEGGVAPNAVPGTAFAVVDTTKLEGLLVFGQAEGITVSDLDDGCVRIEAQGKSAHASTPELGSNAIGMLVDYLLVNDACTYAEKQFLMLQRALLRTNDGSGLGIHARDEHFGTLTAVGSTVSIEDGRIVQVMDCRYPTTTTSSAIGQKVSDLAGLIDATFQIVHDAEPFLVAPDSPAIQALLSAYNEATGEHAEPFTMKGGTYARMFTCAASFGPEKPWEENPDWVGGMHGPDEGISEDLLKQAFAIYVRTIAKLMEIGW